LFGERVKIFAEDYNGVLSQVLPFFEVVNNPLKAEKYVTWNDLVQPQERTVRMMKDLGKEVIIVEHGMKAVTDYQVDMRDIRNRCGGRPFIADKICVWGNRSRDIMLEAGIGEDRVFVVGSPNLWDYQYKYTCGEEERILRTFAGIKVKDKSDNKLWEFQGHRSGIPVNKERKYIYFFPFHDYNKRGKEDNKRVWDVIKFRSDVIVKLPSGYLSKDDDNPFKELVALPQEEFNKRAITTDTRGSFSNEVNKRLLEKAKCLIATAPGSINGYCWAMDVPVITPFIDYGLRSLKGEVIYDLHPADYTCEVEDINEKIEEVLKNDTLKEQRQQCAREFMGTEVGNPRDLIIKVIRGL
jgi:hypothetical protein